MSILKDKLKSYNYYRDKLPLYLQNSYGITDQVDAWVDILKNVVENEDEILFLLNIFYKDSTNDYIDIIDRMKNSPEDTTDMLDKIGALFGLSRNIFVKYYDQSSATTKSEYINLSDEELLLLIKAQIIRSYFEGTREQIIELYSLLDLLVIYFTTGEAKCSIILVETDESQYSENIKKLFLSGMLNIESMGIQYTFSTYDRSNLLVWDKEVSGEYTGWDGGHWYL